MEKLWKTEERIGMRNLEYLNGRSVEMVKEGHESFAVELRKKNRFQHYQAKRGKVLESNEGEVPLEIREIVSRLMREGKGVRDTILTVFNLIQSREVSIETLRSSYNFASKLLKTTHDADVFVELGLIDQVLIDMKVPDPELFKTITNLIVNVTTATTHNCQVLLDKGLIEILIWHIGNSQGEIRKNLTWALRNMLADSPDIINYALQLGILKKVYEWIEILPDNNLYLIIGLLSKNVIDLNEIEHIAGLLSHAIEISESPQVLTSILWAVFNLSLHDSDRIEKLLKFQEITNAALKYSVGDNFKLAMVCLKVLGNIASSTSIHTQILLDHGVLKCIKQNLASDHSELRKEAYFALSNIVAGAASQISEVFAHENLIKEAVKGVIDSNSEVKIEAWHVFKNILHSHNKDFALKLPNSGLVPILSSALAAENDAKILEMALTFCEDLLIAGELEGFNTISSIFHAAGCFESISRHTTSNNPQISKISEEIIEGFYDFRPDEDY